MLYNSDYIKKTAIVKNINRAVSAGTIATPESLAEGEVVVTDLSGNVLNVTTVLDKKKIRIVQGRGVDKDTVAVELGLKELVSYKGSPYVAPVEEVAYFGFNGTTGSLNAVNNYPYVPFVRLTSNTMFFGKQNYLYWYGPYTSPATGTTQLVVARGITRSLLANFSAQYEVDKFIKVERVSDGTFGTAVASVTVTKGSSTVTGTGIGTAFSTGLSGRFGGNVGSTPVYVGTSVSADVATLDIPWQGDSGVITINVQTVAPTNWGIKLTGQVEKFNIASFRMYDKLTFTVGEKSGALTSEVATQSNPGSGTPAQVQIDENASWGFEGAQYLLGIPPTPRPTDVVSTGTYATLAVGFKKSTNHMNGIGSVKGMILVYPDANGGARTNATGASTSVVDVLDVWASQEGFDAQASEMSL